MSELGLIVVTESGTQYFFDTELSKVVRYAPEGGGLRRDGEMLHCSVDQIAVGVPMRIILEPLGEGAFTSRTTSPVTDILVPGR